MSEVGQKVSRYSKNLKNFYNGKDDLSVVTVNIKETCQFGAFSFLAAVPVSIKMDRLRENLTLQMHLNYPGKRHLRIAGLFINGTVKITEVDVFSFSQILGFLKGSCGSEFVSLDASLDLLTDESEKLSLEPEGKVEKKTTKNLGEKTYFNGVDAKEKSIDSKKPEKEQQKNLQKNEMRLKYPEMRVDSSKDQEKYSKIKNNNKENLEKEKNIEKNLKQNSVGKVNKEETDSNVKTITQKLNLLLKSSQINKGKRKKSSSLSKGDTKNEIEKSKFQLKEEKADKRNESRILGDEENNENKNNQQDYSKKNFKNKKGTENKTKGATNNLKKEYKETGKNAKKHQEKPLKHNEDVIESSVSAKKREEKSKSKRKNPLKNEKSSKIKKKTKISEETPEKTDIDPKKGEESVKKMKKELKESEEKREKRTITLARNKRLDTNELRLEFLSRFLEQNKLEDIPLRNICRKMGIFSIVSKFGTMKQSRNIFARFKKNQSKEAQEKEKKTSQGVKRGPELLLTPPVNEGNPSENTKEVNRAVEDRQKTDGSELRASDGLSRTKKREAFKGDKKATVRSSEELKSSHGEFKKSSKGEEIDRESSFSSESYSSEDPSSKKKKKSLSNPLGHYLLETIDKNKMFDKLSQKTIKNNKKINLNNSQRAAIDVLKKRPRYREKNFSKSQKHTNLKHKDAKNIPDIAKAQKNQKKSLFQLKKNKRKRKGIGNTEKSCENVSETTGKVQEENPKLIQTIKGETKNIKKSKNTANSHQGGGCEGEKKREKDKMSCKSQESRKKEIKRLRKNDKKAKKFEASAGFDTGINSA